MFTFVGVVLIAWLGSGFLLSIQVLLSYLAARSAVKSTNAEWKAEGVQVLDDFSRLRGEVWGTMGIILIAPWYLARLPEGIIR